MTKRLREKAHWSWKAIDLPGTLVEKLSREFELQFHEAALDTDPANLEVLTTLGDLYTRQGLFQKGLEIDEKLVGLQPDEPVFHYNLACSYSLVGNLDTAFAALRRAIRLGYHEFEQLCQDPDLENLRADKRWEQLIELLSEKEPGL